MPDEVAWVYYETSEVEGENEIECPISSNSYRKWAAARNTTKSKTTSAGTTNEYREFDKEYVAQLLKKKLKIGAPKKAKKKTSCDKGRKRMTKEQDKNKLKNNATLFVLLENMDSINFYPKIERIEGMSLMRSGHACLQMLCLITL